MSSDQGLLLHNDRYLAIANWFGGADASSNPELLDCGLYDAQLGRVCVDVFKGLLGHCPGNAKPSPGKSCRVPITGCCHRSRSLHAV